MIVSQHAQSVLTQLLSTLASKHKDAANRAASQHVPNPDVEGQPVRLLNWELLDSPP